MYPWEGMASQALGMGLGQAYQQQYYSPQMYGNSITFSTPADTTLHIGNTDDVSAENVNIEVEELPSEFKQLSNHKFHELLAKFSESI